MSERRMFTRIPFDAKVSFTYGGKSWNTELIDISLKGALFETPAEWHFEKDELISFNLAIGEDAFKIIFDGRVAHSKNNQIGVTCEHIDIDSATHLKRLVELNLGDSLLLGRELHALSNI